MTVVDKVNQVDFKFNDELNFFVFYVQLSVAEGSQIKRNRRGVLFQSISHLISVTKKLISQITAISRTPAGAKWDERDVTISKHYFDDY